MVLDCIKGTIKRHSDCFKEKVLIHANIFNALPQHFLFKRVRTTALALSMWNLPRPGVELVSPVSVGGFSTMGSPGKSKVMT